MSKGTMLVLGLLVLGTMVFADDAPHWIGLDTTARDQITFVQPTTTEIGAALDTWTCDSSVSAGATVYGVLRPGFLLLFK